MKLKLSLAVNATLISYLLSGIAFDHGQISAAFCCLFAFMLSLSYILALTLRAIKAEHLKFSTTGKRRY